MTHDPERRDDDDDAVERLGRRVGRLLGTVFMAALAVYLIVTYL